MMNLIAVKDIPALIRHMTEQMNSKRAGLSELDAQAGDGDLGVTIALIFRTLSQYTKDLRAEETFSTVFSDMSEAVEENAPSTFGTFVATMLCSMSDSIGNTSAMDGAMFANMLKAAAEGVMRRGGAKLGDKTLLDALIPAGEAAGEAAEQGGSFAATVKCAAEASRRGAEHTEHLKATTGRAGYMGERTIGSRDPGAEAIALILESFSDFCNS